MQIEKCQQQQRFTHNLEEIYFQVLFYMRYIHVAQKLYW